MNFLTSILIHSVQIQSNSIYCGLLDFNFRISLCTYDSPSFVVPREGVPITTMYIPSVSAPTDKTSMRRPYLKSSPKKSPTTSIQNFIWIASRIPQKLFYQPRKRTTSTCVCLSHLTNDNSYIMHTTRTLVSSYKLLYRSPKQT